MLLFSRSTICTFLIVFTFFSSSVGQQKGYNQALTIKFVDEASLLDAKQIKNQITQSGKLKSNTKGKELDLKWERVFPPAGKFEEKHKAYGLHLWYRLRYDSSIIADKDALKLFKSNPQIEITEFFAASATSLPTDSLFDKQWNFHNTGQRRGLVGHDVDFINSSKLESGDPRVVVSIHDTGLDLYNPELTANLWVNEDEIPDNDIDDDDNGYIDDVHGWGFGEQNKKLNDTHGHGSHIGGVIAAKWDNKGVAGLAGGKDSTDGVRLMVCRLDWDGPGLDIIRPEESLVYAADNGANISQNSWNTFGVSYSVKAAVAYFTAEAKNEMMEGGVVVFAAGNNGSSTPRYEAENPRVMMIANIERDSKLNTWSNSGSWIAVAAPGTDIFSNGTFGNYVYMSGTSMAAPHASGVAALVVSKFGSATYTPEEVINRIKSSAINIDEFNPYRIGHTGSGRVNAFRALLEPDTIAPDSSIITLTSVRAYDATISWPTPNDNTIAAFHYIIALKKDGLIDVNNFDEYIFDTLDVKNPEYDDILSYTIQNLEAESNYSIAIKSLDYFMNESAISNNSSFVTLGKPELEISNYQSAHQLYIDSTYSSSFIIKNNGDSELEWKLSKSPIHKDSLDFTDLKVGIFTEFYMYTEVKAYIESKGGSMVKLPFEFYESDLNGIHILLLEAGVFQLDSARTPLINQWVKRGGNLIVAINGEYPVKIVNTIIGEMGVSIQTYPEYRQETTERIVFNHPINENIIELGLSYYDTYIQLLESSFEPLVYDNSGNVCAAVSDFNKGKVFLATNNFLGSFYISNKDNPLFTKNIINWFSKFNSIKSTQWAGKLESNKSDTLTLTFNHNLGSTFNSSIYLHTNDPDNVVSLLDYSINISGYPIGKLDISVIDFDTLFVEFSKNIPIVISNKGTDVLNLYRKQEYSTSFLYSLDTLVLMVGEEKVVSASFYPKQSGTFYDTLTFFGYLSDTFNIYIKGVAQWPPLLEAYPSDTIMAISALESPVNKSVYIKNKGIGIDLESNLALRPIVLPNAPPATINFKGKRIGVTNLDRYNTAFSKLELDSNEVFDFKIHLELNTYTLDEIDLIILDNKFYGMTVENLALLVGWIKQGGKILVQTDQYTTPNRFTELFEETDIKEIKFYGSHRSDTLREIVLHPITENIDQYFALQHYSHLVVDNPSKVLVYDANHKPHIAYDYIGEGKVLLIANDAFYIPSPNSDLRLLIQSMNWLMNPEKPFWVDFKPHNFVTPIGETESASFAFHSDSIPYHEARLEIKSNDPYQPSKSIKVIFTSDTIITNPNNAPSFAYSPSQLSIKENTLSGTVLDTLKGFDKDGDFLYFSVLDQELGVSINVETGVLSVQNSEFLNFEIRPSFDIMVSVSDKIDTTIIGITVNIEDINEAPQLIGQFLEMDEDESKEWIINYEDPEGDSVSAEFTISDTTLFSVSNLTWNARSQTLALSPKADVYGETHLNLSLSDGVITKNFILPITIRPINDSPIISSLINKILIADSTFIDQISVTDVDSDTLILQFSFSNSSIIDELSPVEIIKEGDSLAVTFYLKPLKRGATLFTIVIIDGQDSVAAQCNIEVKSLAEIMAGNKHLDGLSIYPNPVNSILNVDYKKEPLIGYYLSDLLGRTVHSALLNNTDLKHTLNLEKIPSGLYLLNLETQSGNIKQVRILVE